MRLRLLLIAAGFLCATTARTLTKTPSSSNQILYLASCMGKEDGNYGDDCSRYFYKCHDGDISKMECPVGLVYAAINRDCSGINDIFSCRESDALLKLTTTTAATTTAFTDRGRKSCRGKEDGYYGEDCSAYFYRCSHQRIYRVDCPPGLLWDTASQLCEYSSERPECTLDEVLLKSTAIGTTVTAFVDKGPISCFGLEDGYYSNDCSTYFYACRNGFTSKVECPVGLVYDSINEACDKINNIIACRGSGARLKLTTTSTPTTTPPAFTDNGLNSCIGMQDGNHGEDCSTHFYKCTNQFSVKMDCGLGLVWHTSSHQCDYRDNNHKCYILDSIKPQAR